MAITRIAVRRLPKLLERLEVRGKRLGHALRIVDLDAGDHQADERERHCQAVVVVRAKAGRVWLARPDGQAVVVLFGLDAAAPQLGDHRGDAIALLAADETDAADRRG